MELTTVYAILLILSEHTSIDALPDLSKKLRNQQSEYHTTTDKSAPLEIIGESVHNNQNGLHELPNILGKQVIALIRRNFQLLEQDGLTGLKKKNNNDFDLEEEPPKLKNSNNLEDNNDSDKTRMVEILDDVRLLGIGLSKDASGGRRREKLDFIELHKLSIIANTDKLAVMATPKPRTVGEAEMNSSDDENEDNSQTEGNKQTQVTDNSDNNIIDVFRDGIETVNKLGFVSNFFVREIQFNCTEGKYYKRDDCNICFCTKGSQWKPCTKVKCAKEHSDLVSKMLLSKPIDRPLENWRLQAIGCIPGQKIKSPRHDKCGCVCALPSVMQCPLCAAVDHIKIKPDEESGKSHSKY